jgi:RNA polymerase sigma-70 factor (ECF subfamily)
LTPRVDVPDEALMVRYQRGDRSAFTLLVRRHQGGLYNFALRLLRVRSVAEDMVQETFVRVVQNATEFKHEARFSTWVYTIARNLCFDQLRKQSLRRHPSLDEARKGEEGDGPTLGEQTADSKASVERQATGTQIKERILAAVDELPNDQREVFLLREVSNLPFKEIAEITGVPENTVKSRMRYALERLQAALSDFEEYARALR